MESSRTSLASRTSSRTHFEVLGLGLEASSPRKLPCPRLEDSIIFEPLKFRWKTPETLRKICKNFFFWFPQIEIARKKIFEDLFCLKKIFEDLFFFGEHLRLCPWPWPREGLSLASKFFLCPWPRALCSQLHLWSLQFTKKHTVTCQVQKSSSNQLSIKY